MIPSKLVFVREVKTESGEEQIEFLTNFGLAECKPQIGRRFILMAGEKGEVIKTGIIEMIEWKNTEQECYFYTGSSTYVWAKVEDA